MNHYPTKGESLWNATVRRTEFSSHRGDLDVDVAVIGAGIAGLTTAYMLKQKGKKVAVFEKYQIGDSVTGYTTAKVSSQHGLIYHELIEKHGKGHAQVYADANQGAIDTIEAIIATENISCEWRRADSYVYTDKSSELRAIKDEVLAAQSLGLPASYTESLPLNIAAKAAVRFTHQASFNVLDYLYGLVNAIEGQGSRVYEHTKVSNVHDGERVTFKVPGGTVTANEVVLATNIPSPILDHIAYGLYEYPVRSYLIAGPVESRIDDMYINTGNPTRSIHSLNINGKPWMMMGGEAHMVGVSGPAEGH
jgi:glycine/D-amino acid oxidase-like deaminating enzyme